MKLFRVFLLVAIVIAVIGQVPSPTIAQDVPAGVIYPKTTGTVGTFSVSIQRIICEQQSSAELQMKMTLTGPKPQLINGTTSGRVEWTPGIYQYLFGTRGHALVQQGTTQTLTISTSNTRSFEGVTFEHLPGGGFYSAGGTLTWYNSNLSIVGTYSFIFQQYDFRSRDSVMPQTNYCNPIVSPSLGISTTRTTVDTVIALQGFNFPPSQPVKITWRGNVVGTVTSDAQGNVNGAYKLAATPMGSYPLGLDGGQMWKVSAQVTVVPRIKVIPSSAGRGQTVKVSLRGFAKGEIVRVRWVKGGGWVELGRVTMSSTGSGELWIPVPTWVPDGASSVRGDGTSGRAQTNAVVISGGAGFRAASEKTPTPTPTATVTATATLTATIPASPEISPTVPPTSTEVTSTPSPSPTETPTETLTPTETFEPTVEPSPTQTGTQTPADTATAATTP